MTKQEKFQNSALKLIHEKGFKAMTMRDLAAEMSCDIKNIYNYTPSKIGLLESLLHAMSQEFHEGIDKILNAQLTAVQQIEELIRLHVNLSYEKPLRVGLLANEYRNLKDPFLSEFLGERKDYEKKVSSILTNGMQTKVFRELNVSIATQSILGSLRWQYDYYYRKDGKLNPFDTIEELKLLIMPGLLRS